QYVDEANGPWFPFGDGLSYTPFDVACIKLSAAGLTRNGKVTASVTVKNTGKVAGATVVQLYLHDVAASISRPVKELKNCEKVMLEQGEEKVVTFTPSEDELKFYNSELKHVAEPGECTVMSGLELQAVKEATCKTC
ncbi:beta-glucosidase, partial [Pseudomonas syringae]